ncbi:MAG: cytochrome-c oxidase, cbb3-type subunit II, partial [Bacteroidota bacterium]|nr:cytochrome-c oxidase, cbb3-type subunit II [Bacteroidota bacterium]MDX5429481.1 cytochrome-c oxidase, cbb3-type subunit II [Bacteroidota bacterium]MDX5468268.1 cytochrome-c oxidase, cbb3-type subunit II [Bacteroidota bacterium]
VMIYNLAKTVASGSLVANEEAEAPALVKEVSQGKEYWHRVIERKPTLLLVLSLIVILIGGIVEMVPTFLIESNVPTIAAVKPYTPLELEGRDLYIKEGCVGCHSQMVRPFRSETERYGEYSKAGEFVYDHPFLWGSKRTGPDLAREGTSKLFKQDSWHYYHLVKPEEMTQGSIMPPYPWLASNELNTSSTADKINAMRTLGVPYPEGYENQALKDLQAQAQKIADNLDKEGVRLEDGSKVAANTEIVALIAYLQRLGTDITKSETANNQ